MKTWHKIIIGDSRDMKEVEDSSIHLVVTSPPYVTSEFRRGQCFDIDEYLELIRDVFKEIRRVLIPDGRMCLNMADVHTKYYYKDYDRFYRIPLAHMVLDVCLKIGFRLLDTIIWNKGFNRRKGGYPGPLFGSYPYPPTIYSNVYWEYIFVLVKPGPRRRVPREIKERSKLSYEEWKEYTRGFWNIPSESWKIKEHPSVFPLELAKRCIKMYSFVGDTVLDPFLGSGTTTLAAKLTGRNSIGYEINPKYLDLIKYRIGYEDSSSRDNIKIIIK